MFIANKNEENPFLLPPESGSYTLHGWQKGYFIKKLEPALTF